jgi:hypothetical protein|tara:strand:+ start:903 stop:1334 length:432 start_codon:yes stop_codon:yes gene_type:complete
MTLQDEIKESLKLYSPNIVISYGRSFDTALATYRDEIQEWFAFIDPISFNGKANDIESANLVIGFLKQDEPDSSFDKDDNLELNQSIEEIQSDAHTFALGWLNYFLDNYNYSDGNYTLDPVTRIKNVMSGKLLKVTLNGKPKC